MDAHHDYELNPDAPPFQPSHPEDMPINRKAGADYDQQQQTRMLIEPAAHFDYNERLDYNYNPNVNANPSMLRSAQRLIDQAETQVRDAPPPNVMDEDFNRDRIDSISNDSLLHLTGEELAQREREIFGEHYWSGQKSAAADSSVMSESVESRGPSFIPKDAVPDQSVVARRRAVSQYIRDLVMWRNVKDSAVIFSFGSFVLFSLAYFSFISVLSYGALTVLLLASGFVFARQLVFTMQQREGGAHPFQRLLEKDVVISPEYAHQQVDLLLQPVNRTLLRMRNVFLADSLGQSLKWALGIYLMTYVGAWCNLLTLAMVVWVMAFSVPRLYVMYRSQIDGMLRMVRDRLVAAKQRLIGMIRREKRKAADAVPASSSGAVKVEKKVTIEKRRKVQ